MSAEEERCTALLKNVFKKETFRTHQLPIVLDVAAGRDVFVQMPTGGGKSLCYQLPALLSATGVTIVVSPLLALIQNQLLALEALGIAAASLNSTTPASKRAALMTQLRSEAPSIRLLYVTAEMMATEGFFALVGQMLRRGTCTRIVIDEAHCICEWGDDFRPDYRRLRRYKAAYAALQICAFTASATKEVVRDVVEELGIATTAVLHTTSFCRRNIRYCVRMKQHEDDADAVIQTIADAQKAAKSRVIIGIVYCHARSDCERIAAAINAAFSPDNRSVHENESIAVAYHAGLAVEARERIQRAWLDGCGPSLVVATVSFGMGIDNPHVRLVVHFCLPKSFEAYYQETGRAGRDGASATAVLLYHEADAARLRFLVEREIAAVEAANSSTASAACAPTAASWKRAVRSKQRSFDALLEFCHEATQPHSRVCLRRLICGYFGERVPPEQSATLCEKSCSNCDRSLRVSSSSPPPPLLHSASFFSSAIGAGGFSRASQLLSAAAKTAATNKRGLPMDARETEFTASVQKTFRVHEPQSAARCVGLTNDFRERCIDKIVAKFPDRCTQSVLRTEHFILDASSSIVFYKAKMAAYLKGIVYSQEACNCTS